MTPDRLDELATFQVDEGTPDDARISIPARDLRDLVALVPVVRAAIEWWGKTGDDRPLYEAVEVMQVGSRGDGA